MDISVIYIYIIMYLKYNMYGGVACKLIWHVNTLYYTCSSFRCHLFKPITGCSTCANEALQLAMLIFMPAISCNWPWLLRPQKLVVIIWLAMDDVYR